MRRPIGPARLRRKWKGCSGAEFTWVISPDLSTTEPCQSPATWIPGPTSQDPITRFAKGLVIAGALNAVSNTRPTADKESYLFHGYHFHQVTEDSAAGNNMKDGVVLVAYPADYRSSGVKTFIVTKRGIVYEKDLGSTRTILAKAFKRGPDSSWHVAE